MFARCGPRELRHIPYTGARTYGYMYIYIYTHMYIVHCVYIQTGPRRVRQVGLSHAAPIMVFIL